MTSVRLTSVLMAASCLVAPSWQALAQEQQPQRNVTVQDRPRPAFEPLGIRAGGFLIFPELAVRGEYDSNVFASDNNEEDDFGAIVAPRITARSQFSRHQINLTAGAEGAFFQDFDDNNYLDLDVGANGRLDITRANSVRGSLSFARRHEGRADPDEGGADDLTKYLRGDARLGYRHNFNRLFIQPSVSASRWDFEDDPGNINNDDRDRNRYVAGLRAGYAISPRISVFGEGEYRIVRYDETPDDSGVDRDSDGFALRAGTEVDITGLLFGELAVGYVRQDPDDSSLDTTQGVSALGQLTWNPTPLTTVIGSVEVETLETTVTFQGDDASFNFQKAISLDVTHELLRNLLLNANAAYIRDDFEDTARSDDTFSVGAGLRYLVNRNVGIDATYNFTTRSSDADTEEYDRHIVRVGVVGRL